MNENHNKWLLRLVVWLFLLMLPGPAGSLASAQTPDALNANAGSAQTPDASTVNSIISLLTRHDQALNQKVLNTVMSLYATGDTTVLMGAGPGEKWVGKDEISDAYKHFFQDFDKRSLAHVCFWKTGGAKGDIAWLTAISKMSDTLKKQKEGIWAKHLGGLRAAGIQLADPRHALFKPDRPWDGRRSQSKREVNGYRKCFPIVERMEPDKWKTITG